MKDTGDQVEVPRHVAIIMDGNGRWAAKKNLGRIRGHRAGVKAIRTVTETAIEMGISYITLYAFSSENWSRPQDEINALFRLLYEFVEKEVPGLLKNGIRLQAIGDLEKLPEKTLNKLKWGLEQTKNCTNLQLILALNYGSRNEIIRACKKLKDMLRDDGEREISEEMISSLMYTSEYPDPDLLIRTSGEQRLSNFLLWQLSYAELYFTDVLWPDFSRDDFVQAIDSYKNRKRRFGGI